jgi:hypothetical protein
LYGPIPNLKEGKNVKRKKAEAVAETTPEEKFSVPIAEIVAAVEEPAQVRSLKLDPKVDTAIREALRTLAATPGRGTRVSIAPQLIEAYGDELRAARKQNHSWHTVARIFRAHGIHIGENALKAGIGEA